MPATDGHTMTTEAEAPVIAPQPQPKGVASHKPADQPAGTLLSVNVGLPKDVSWQGRTVFTGVFKNPVTGPRRVRRLNVDGDGQGDLTGHGGEQRAVFVYQMDSYRYWERELGRHDFVYGQFGENFTVEGLRDDEVCIGDRYRIGRATFEVTQPRVTCYRVGIRMNDPQIPALLVSRHRPGFYFRVLEEGEVQAGDEIIKLSTGPEQMPVAEVDGLLYLPGHGRQELLRALRIPALSPGWQASFRALLDQDPASGNAGLGAPSPPPAWLGFRTLAVTAITHEQGARREAVLISVKDVDVVGFVNQLRREVVEKIKLPAGYRVEFSGAYKNWESGSRRLAVAAGVFLLASLLLMYAALQNWRQTGLVAMGIPFALAGGIYGLWFRDLPFTLPAAVGLVTLGGLSLLNGMVLMTGYNQLLAEGIAPLAAALQSATTRLRPVLMTALVASIGFVPMAVSQGIGAEVQRPFATVVIFGILSSTSLTLVLLPLWLPKTAARGSGLGGHTRRIPG